MNSPSNTLLPAGAVFDALFVNPERIVLFTQPVQTIDGGPAFEEVLCRISDGQGGLLAPGLFMPVMDSEGWHLALDRAVLAAMADLPPAARSVNLRLSSLFDERVVEGLIALNAKAPLIVELLETEGMGDHCACLERVHALRKLGLTFFADDLGTAQSLSLLALPLDGVKLGREWTQAIQDCPTLVSAVTLGLLEAGYGVVLEGIETAEDLAFARGSSAATHVQGYLLGRPSRALRLSSANSTQHPVGAGSLNEA